MKKIMAMACLLVSLSGCTMCGDRNYRGIYTGGHEVNTFQPCGSEETYWVSASSWILSPLKEYVESSKSQPYQPVYLEFRGRLLNENVDGFAENYDGLIRISEINAKRIDMPAGCISRSRGVGRAR
jgi:hypothetical protein